MSKTGGVGASPSKWKGSPVGVKPHNGCAASSSRTRTQRAAVVVRASSEADRELREGELSVKKGLLGTFLQEGQAEVTAEKYQAYQAEIATRKAEAQKRAAEARANRKGPFGLW